MPLPKSETLPQSKALIKHAVTDLAYLDIKRDLETLTEYLCMLFRFAFTPGRQTLCVKTLIRAKE